MIEHPAFVHKLAQEIAVLRSDAVGLTEPQCKSLDPETTYRIEVLDHGEGTFTSPEATILLFDQADFPVLVAKVMRFVAIKDLMKSESAAMRDDLYRALRAEAQNRIGQAQETIGRLSVED